MLWMRRALLLLAATLASATMAQEPSCRLDPGRPLIFRLDLSVPATFCRGQAAAQDPSCDEFPKASLLQLHGLWPNYRNGGYPEGSCGKNVCPVQGPSEGKYCRYPEPPGLYSQPWWNSLSGQMAGVQKCLERHEWMKHGTCSSMDAPDYFKWALERTQSIVQRLALPADTEISRGQFDTWVKTRVPELSGAMRLTCRGDALSGLYVIYEWGNPPGNPVKNPGGGNHFGNCKQTFYVPTKPD